MNSSVSAARPATKTHERKSNSLTAEGGAVRLWRRTYRSGLARAAARTFPVAAAMRAMQFVMAMLLARQLEPAGFGVFTFALGGGMLAGRLATLGWPMVMARFLPAYRKTGDGARTRGLLRRSDQIVCLAGVAAGLLLWGVGLLLGAGHELAAGLGLAALVTPLAALRSLRRRQLAAAEQPATGFFFDQGFASVGVVLVAALAGFASARDAVLVYVATGLLGVLLAGLLVARWQRRTFEPGHRLYETRTWMAVALPALAGISSRALLNRTDVIMLAPLSTFVQVGYYGAALRLGILLTAPQVVLGTIIAPRFGAALAAGRHGRLRRLYLLAQGIAVVTGLPVSAALFWFAEPIVDLVFGESFAGAVGALQVLALGQLAAALSVPCASLLVVCGKERAFGLVNTVGLVLNVIANLALIPEYGALGAAIATAVAQSLILVGQFTVTLGVLRVPPAAPAPPVDPG